MYITHVHSTLLEYICKQYCTQYTCTEKKPVLIQVEGVSVGLENQGQVVARVAARVAASGSELVADTECEEWHEAAGISSSPAAFPMWSVAMMTQ